MIYRSMEGSPDHAAFVILLDKHYLIIKDDAFAGKVRIFPLDHQVKEILSRPEFWKQIL